MHAGVPQGSRKCRIVKLPISSRSKAYKVAISASRSTSEMPRSVAGRNERASMVFFHSVLGLRADCEGHPALGGYFGARPRSPQELRIRPPAAPGGGRKSDGL